jgi:hypothetical protein
VKIKNMKKLSLFVALILTGAMLSAQTADAVIAKYLDAIGSKKAISKIKSLVVEGTMNIMGMEGVMKTTTLNGKGMKMELDINGSTVVNCLTDQGGWTINPMMGMTGPQDMPEEQYNLAKYQIQIGAPFIFYAEKGFKAELVGEETVGDSKALRIKITSPENSVSEYFFDTDSGYLIRAIQPGDMGETISTFSDYRKDGGYVSPYNIEISAGGGQVEILMKTLKTEVNQPVDESIFNRPE